MSFQVGDIVQISADGRRATVRFVGTTSFQVGEWVGLELEDYSGKNDGSVKGEQYFECEMGRGMFVRPGAITAVKRKSSVAGSATGGAAKKAGSRPSSIVSARRAGSVSESAAAAGKRMSVNAASPTPGAARLARPGSISRVCFFHPKHRYGENHKLTDG